MTDLLAIARFLWPDEQWKLRASCLGQEPFAFRTSERRTLDSYAGDGLPIYLGDGKPSTLQRGSYSCVAEAEARIRELGLSEQYGRHLVSVCGEAWWATATIEERLKAVEMLAA